MSTTTLPPVPAGLAAVTPDDADYRLLQSTYTTHHAPAVILLPGDTAEVSRAVRYAADTDLPVSVRSGGHGLSGRSSNDGGIVIDLSRISHVEVLDDDTGLVRVGAGARWAQVAAALRPHGLAISSGDHGNVGVGGLATAGGIGWLVRSYGLTLDHVRAATVVLPDGSAVRADAEHEPDLLWAVHGAGSFVGIVTELEIEAVRLPGVAVVQLAFEIGDDGEQLLRWADLMADAPRELTMSGVLMTYRGRPVLAVTGVVTTTDRRTAERILEPVRALAGGRAVTPQIVPYTDLVPLESMHPNVGQQPAVTTSALLRRLTPQAARDLAALVRHPAAPFVQLRAIGGAMNDVPADATAWAHRDVELLVTATVFPPGKGRELDAAVGPLWARSVGAYRNFESRPDQRAFERAFPGATGERVRELAARYDPKGLLSRQ